MHKWALVLLLSLTGCHRQPHVRVLFIGNSYTYMNGGIDQQLQELEPAVEASSITAGGRKLQEHFDDPKTLETIKTGKWDFVVLQEQSQTPVVNENAFDDATRRLHAAIQASGAKTILLMTWERPDSVRFGVTTENLSRAYTLIGQELGAIVSPAGEAFARALRERPDVQLYGEDGHPTVAGTYLASCVVYGSIFKRAAGGALGKEEKVLPAETIAFCRRIAGETLGVH